MVGYSRGGRRAGLEATLLLIVALSLSLVFLIRPPGFARGAGIANQTLVDLWKILHLERIDARSPPGRIVFLGSSSFERLPVGRISPLGLGLGKGGDTMSGLLGRLRGYRAPQRAAAVVVNIGLNDVLATCLPEAGGMRDVLSSIPAGIPVVVLGVQGLSPTASSGHCAGLLPDLLAEFNLRIARVCAERNLCTFVESPIPEAVGEASSRLLHERDGIHLSDKGYELLIASLRRALLSLPIASERHSR